MLNIYVHSGNKSLTQCLSYKSGDNMFDYTESSSLWTDATTTNGYYYNTSHNVYIYPVANVEEARIANGD